MNPPLPSFGPSPICDFDGTVATLPVQWDEVRRTLGVHAIEDLWQADDHGGWELVTAAERSAAPSARSVDAVVTALTETRAYAILTNNDETAVNLALDLIPQLSGIRRIVVGRSSLGASKRHGPTFERGFETCRAFLGLERADVVYIGDSRYELDHAGRLGARTILIGPEHRQSDPLAGGSKPSDQPPGELTSRL